MSLSRPFAYNPTPNPYISGTTQVGDIAVGDFVWNYQQNYGGVFWWQGPDEELGYVICNPVSGGTQPNPLSIPAYVGFKRSKLLTEPSFIDIANYVAAGRTTPFTSGNEASIWLTNNGYWNSWNLSTPTPTPTSGAPTQTPTPTPTVTETPTSTPTETPIPTSSETPTPTVTQTQTVTPTNTQTPTVTPTVTPTQLVLINPILAGVDEYIVVGTDEYLMFVDPTSPSTSSTPTPTPTNTETPTPTVTPTQTIAPTNTETPTPTPTVTPTSTEPFFILAQNGDILTAQDGSGIEYQH